MNEEVMLLVESEAQERLKTLLNQRNFRNRFKDAALAKGYQMKEVHIDDSGYGCYIFKPLSTPWYSKKGTFYPTYYWDEAAAYAEFIKWLEWLEKKGE